MTDTPVLKTADELFKKMQRTSVPISSTRKIPAIRFFLIAPQEQIDIFHWRLDSSPYAGRMKFPGKTYSVKSRRGPAFRGRISFLVQAHIRAGSLCAPSLPGGVTLPSAARKALSP